MRPSTRLFRSGRHYLLNKTTLYFLYSIFSVHNACDRDIQSSATSAHRDTTQEEACVTCVVVAIAFFGFLGFRALAVRECDSSVLTTLLHG